MKQLYNLLKLSTMFDQKGLFKYADALEGMSQAELLQYLAREDMPRQCAECKAIFNSETGTWEWDTKYGPEPTTIHATHGLCPDCLKKTWEAELAELTAS